MEHSDNRYFLQIEVEGYRFPALVDPGAVTSYLGAAPSALVRQHWRPNNSGILMPNGQTCRNEGEVHLTLNIDGLRMRARFLICAQLHYDALLGMDILQQAKIRVDFGNHTWSTRRNVAGRFATKDDDSEAQISAVAALGGVADIERSA